LATVYVVDRFSHFVWRSARTDVGLCWSLLWNTYFQIFKTAL